METRHVGSLLETYWRPMDTNKTTDWRPVSKSRVVGHRYVRHVFCPWIYDKSTTGLQ